MVLIREFQDKDYEAVVSLIVELWEYEKMAKSDYARLMGEYDLTKVLAYASFTRVILDGSQVVGFVFASLNTLVNEKYLTRFKEVKRKLYHSRYFIPFYLGVKKLDKINQQLLLKTNKTYEGELSFFGVKKRYQKRHLGTKLFNEVEEYFKSIGVKEYFLYTDNHSNYLFYEKKHMIREATEYLKVPLIPKEENSFYLYDKKIGE